MSVSPENRLVADTLEAEWNEKLRLLKQTEQAYEEQCKQDLMVIDEDKLADLKALIRDFPRLWKDPCTSPRDRKRMTRLLIEDVTLKKGEKITVAIRFKGGATKVLELDPPLNYFMTRKTAKYVVREIDQLLDHHKDSEIASILNEKGCTTGDGLKFTSLSVMRIRQAYKLKSRHGRLRAKGLSTRKQVETALGISSATLQKLKDHGLIRAYQYGGGFVKSLMQDENAQEVQYEA
jgi:hypothetical protein